MHRTLRPRQCAGEHSAPAAPLCQGHSCNQSAHDDHAAGERLVLAGTRALAVTTTEVPELSPGTIERRCLCEVQIVTVCEPSHPLAAIAIWPAHPTRCNRPAPPAFRCHEKTQAFANGNPFLVADGLDITNVVFGSEANR